jgi:UDP-sulfoquinovose synthase
VLELAELVQEQAAKLGIAARIEHLENPRVEAETHYYNPRHQKLIDLGLQPHYLSDVLIGGMLARIRECADRIKPNIILPRVRWSDASTSARQHAVGALRG